ncbi:MAG TPA: hypothetical protein VFP17_00790 [Solirubrobacterales bacterium]|nr:hypothetical protein [Solirubrobacterales bacterium]
MNLSRQLRLLGLAVLALVATGAVSASGAQAGLFTAGAFPATITGSIVAPHELGTDLGTMECEPTLDGELAAAVEELTLTPIYGNTCHLGMKEVDVNNNGCDFVVHATATAGENAVEGKLDIVCPENNAMDFQVTSNPVCHLTVPAQANLGTLTYTNHPMAKDVDLDFNIVELVYRLDNNCPFAGNHANGIYRGVSTLKADHGGAETSFGVD